MGVHIGSAHWEWAHMGQITTKLDGNVCCRSLRSSRLNKALITLVEASVVLNAEKRRCSAMGFAPP